MNAQTNKEKNGYYYEVNGRILRIELDGELVVEGRCRDLYRLEWVKRAMERAIFDTVAHASVS